MKILTFLFTILLSLQSFAIGAEWLLEIGYYYNGKYQIGYVHVDAFNNQYPELVGQDKAFEKYFHEQFKEDHTITLYDRIVDQEALSKAATFPMHPYRMVHQSKRELKLRNMKKMRLIKVWERMAYGINVLSELGTSDLNWISRKHERIQSKFQDVGCRLELYDYSGIGPDHPLIHKLNAVYPNDGGYMTESQFNKLLPIIRQLKEKNVVVVEMCGC